MVGKNKQRGFLDLSGIVPMLVGFGIVAGIVIGAIIFKGIPWLWEISKPWLHSITG
jgi:hypothetical protein